MPNHKLEKAFRTKSRNSVFDYDFDEIIDCCDAYVDFVMEQYETTKHGYSDYHRPN